MKLTKKLVIMSGKAYEKGTVALEKNAVSLHGRANLHSLRNLSHEEYLLVLICASQTFFVDLGCNGTTTKQFSLPLETDISSLHCAVLVGETLALYGTTENSKMWEGNIIDIVRRKNIESKTDNYEDSQSTQTQGKNSTGRGNTYQTTQPKQDINNYFLDIISDYNDEAVAEVNYYNVKGNAKIEARKVEQNAKNDVQKQVEQPAKTSKTSTINNIEDNLDKTHRPAARMESSTDTIYKSFKPVKPSETGNTVETGNKSEINNKVVSEDKHSPAMAQKIEKLDYDEKYSSKKFKEYYDSLKEKYGYNKNVLNDLKGAKEQSVEQTAKPLRADNSIQQKTRREENSASQSHRREENFASQSHRREENFASQSHRREENSAPQHPRREENSVKQNSSHFRDNIDVPFTPIVEAASTLSASDIPPIEPAFERIRLGTFFEQIKDQIEVLFKNNQHSTELEELIPESKWVKVDYSSDGKFYVVGVIGKPDYICYGVPAVYTAEPPKELDGYCQWLPLDISEPTKNGYWLLFQDAVSGESIKNEII